MGYSSTTVCLRKPICLVSMDKENKNENAESDADVALANQTENLKAELAAANARSDATVARIQTSLNHTANVRYNIESLKELLKDYRPPSCVNDQPLDSSVPERALDLSTSEFGIPEQDSKRRRRF